MTDSVAFDFSNKVVCITGSSGYLGSLLAEKFLASGAVVIGLDRSEPRSQSVLGTKFFHFLKVDLESTSSLNTACAYIFSKFSSIDVLVNNAAFVGTSELEGWGVEFEHQSVETWRRALEVNLTSVFSLCQSIYPLLKEADAASIINIGSIYAHLGPDWSLYDNTDMANPAAYAASKGGIVQLTRWLATTIKPDIRVNCVSPGGIFRNQPEQFVRQFERRTPLGRMASEDDIVGPVLFLASNLSSYMTGQNLIVDGGWSAW